jgi:hypothetical protein
MTKKLISHKELREKWLKTLTPEEKEISNKRAKLHSEKLREYMKTVNIPFADDMEKYAEWLNNTPEGKEHAKNLERIEKEVNKECDWGGVRQGAGRKPKENSKVTFTRRLTPETVAILKDYAKEHHMNETEALETAILKLKQA